MKISYRTHPPLEYLKKSLVEKVWIDESEAPRFNLIRNEFKLFFDQNIDQLKDIRVYTLPFLEAAEKGAKKLFYAGKFINIHELPNCIGTMILLDKTVFYKIIKHEIYLALFSKQYLHAFLHFNREGGTSAFVSDQFKAYIKAEHIIQNQEFEDDIPERDASFALMWAIKYVVFANFVDIETKHLQPGQRAKEISCKYINESDLPVKIINSTWFTTLVKSDAFKVSGHFRWQPYGEGLKDRKLIWITEFEKSGYTAPARKLSHT